MAGFQTLDGAFVAGIRLAAIGHHVRADRGDREKGCECEAEDQKFFEGHEEVPFLELNGPPGDGLGGQLPDLSDDELDDMIAHQRENDRRRKAQAEEEQVFK